MPHAEQNQEHAPQTELSIWDGIVATHDPVSQTVRTTSRLRGLFGGTTTSWTNEGVTAFGHGQVLVSVEECIPSGIGATLGVQIPTIHAQITEQDPEDTIAPKRALYDLSVSPSKLIRIAARRLQPIRSRSGERLPDMYETVERMDRDDAAQNISRILSQAVFVSEAVFL